MKTKPTRRIEFSLIALLAGIALGVFALFQAPRLFGDAAPRSQEFDANRERLEQMTQSQRDRVERRSEKFAELSDSRRNELRKLHADLQTAPDATELKKVLKRYNDWLTSLRVGERDKLRTDLQKAKTPAEQLQVVVETKHKIEDLRLLDSAPFFERQLYYRETDPRKKEEILARVREAYSYGTQRSRGPTLNPEELDAVINVIAAQLKPSEARKAEWAKLNPPQRRLKIMIAALKEHTRLRRQWKPPKREPGKREPGQEREPRVRPPGLLGDSDLKKPIEEGITDAALRERLLKRSPIGRRWFFWANYRILYLVRNSLEQERRQEAGKPTEEQLGRFFEGLSEEKLEELAQKGPEKMKTLKWWYFLSGGDNGEDYRTFVTELYPAIRPIGFGKRGGNRQGGPSRRGRGRSGQRQRNQQR